MVESADAVLDATLALHRLPSWCLASVTFMHVEIFGRCYYDFLRLEARKTAAALLRALVFNESHPLKFEGPRATPCSLELQTR